MRLKFWEPVYPEYHSALINTKSGRTFKGVITRHINGYVIVSRAEILSDGGSTPADGEVLIPKRDVEFIQVIK